MIRRSVREENIAFFGEVEVTSVKDIHAQMLKISRQATDPNMAELFKYPILLRIITRFCTTSPFHHMFPSIWFDALYSQSSEACDDLTALTTQRERLELRLGAQ